MINAVKQAGEVGMQSVGQKLVGIILNINDVQALGPAVAGGTLATDAYYWDRNDESRAFAQRFQERHGAMPSQYQAGDWSAVTYYLKAIAAAGTDEGEAVRAEMRETQVADFFSPGSRLPENSPQCAHL